MSKNNKDTKQNNIPNSAAAEQSTKQALSQKLVYYSKNKNSSDTADIEKDLLQDLLATTVYVPTVPKSKSTYTYLIETPGDTPFTPLFLYKSEAEFCFDAPDIKITEAWIGDIVNSDAAEILAIRSGKVLENFRKTQFNLAAMNFLKDNLIRKNEKEQSNRLAELVSRYNDLSSECEYVGLNKRPELYDDLLACLDGIGEELSKAKILYTLVSDYTHMPIIYRDDFESHMHFPIFVDKSLAEKKINYFSRTYKIDCHVEELLKENFVKCFTIFGYSIAMLFAESDEQAPVTLGCLEKTHWDINGDKVHTNPTVSAAFIEGKQILCGTEKIDKKFRDDETISFLENRTVKTLLKAELYVTCEDYDAALEDKNKYLHLYLDTDTLHKYNKVEREEDILHDNLAALISETNCSQFTVQSGNCRVQYTTGYFLESMAYMYQGIINSLKQNKETDQGEE